MKLDLPISLDWSIADALRLAQKFLPCQTNRVEEAVISLKLNGDRLIVRVPSFEMTYNTSVPVENVTDPYDKEFLVNAKLFNRIISESTASETVSLLVDADAGFVIVTLGSARWQVPMIRVSSHGFVESSTEEGIDIDSEKLHESLVRVSGAVSLESIRPYLRVVDCLKGRVRACDGSMYIHYDTGMPDLTFSIPVNVLKPFMTYLSERPLGLTFSESDFAYHFSNPTDYVSFAKPAVDFPDLDSLLVRPMKSQVPSVLLLNREDFTKALTRVGLMTSKDYGEIELDITADTVVVRCAKSNGAESSSHLSCQWGSAPRSTKFNIGDLRGILNSIPVDDDSPLVELRFGKDNKDRKSPVVIEGEHTWSMLNQLR